MTNGIKIWTDFSSVFVTTFDRDRRTHSMQRGKTRQT